MNENSPVAPSAEEPTPSDPDAAPDAPAEKLSEPGPGAESYPWL